MDENNAADIIRVHPELDYTSAKTQFMSAGGSAEVFEKAWEDAGRSNASSLSSQQPPTMTQQPQGSSIRTSSIFPNTLLIRQKKEWTEILTSFESKNKYAISDEQENQLFWALEDKGSFLVKQFLRSNRPFTIKILDLQEKIFLTLKRPFRFYYHEVEIFDESNVILGKVKRDFSIFNRNYTIYDSNGSPVANISGNFFHPWTFNILENGTQVSQILKKWSGAFTEIASKADNFLVSLPPSWPADRKKLILGAAFLIDFNYFENKK